MGCFTQRCCSSLYMTNVKKIIKKIVSDFCIKKNTTAVCYFLFYFYNSTAEIAYISRSFVSMKFMNKN